MTKFWLGLSDKFKIDAISLFRYIQQAGFFTFKPIRSIASILVQIKGKFVKEVDNKAVRKHCWNYLENSSPFDTPEEERIVKNGFLSSKQLFHVENLDLLESVEISEVKDSEECSFLFFKNCYLEIQPDKIRKHDYSELNGHVWENDVIQFDLNCEMLDEILPTGEFYEFCMDISKHPNKEIEAKNLDSLITIIGYLLHRYKDPSNPRAVILMDSYKDGSPNGRTGKGIFGKAVGHIRSLAFQNGKQHKQGERFALSNVSYSTRVLFFDDVPKNFNFERLFPTISEDTVVEKKYKDKFSIPYEESPKVLITTNYTVDGTSESHKGRKVEFVLSDTYSTGFSPKDRFGHKLFDDWNLEEWERFYLFMSYCLQQFLINGIVPPIFNVAERRLNQAASKEFIKFVNHELDPGVRYNKRDVYETFISKLQNYQRIEQYTFTKWLKLFAEACGMRIDVSHSGKDNFFELTLGEEVQDER